MNDTRTSACRDCRTPIEQTPVETIIGISWRPILCDACDQAVAEVAQAKSLAFAQATERVLDLMGRAGDGRKGIRDEIRDGRITLESLPKLYDATRTESGVSSDRYREVVRAVLDFVRLPPLLRTTTEKSVLLLHGPRGVGKSLILEAACGYALRELRQTARFMTPPDVLAILTADDADAESNQRVYAKLASLDLLALDDLRRKKQPTNWELSAILNVVDNRLRECKPTLISCGLGPSELAAAWLAEHDTCDRREVVGELVDRISSTRNALVIGMNGASLRRERVTNGRD